MASSAWGHRVSLGLTDGTTLDGWLYAETDDGFYVSLDRDGSDIRFVPNDHWQGARYFYDDPASFRAPEQMRDRVTTDEELQREMRSILDSVDYRRVRQTYAGLRYEATKFDGPVERLEYQGDEPMSQAGRRVIRIYGDLLDECRRVGLDDLILKRRETLRELSSRGLIPRFDLGVFGPLYSHRTSEVIQMVSAAPEEISAARMDPRHVVAVADKALDDLDGSDSTGTSAWPRRLRKIAAIGKIAVGGTLTAANITAGAFVGIVSALPTLGMGTIAGAVGVATSAYTGLNAACDGLKDLGTAIETPPKRRERPHNA